jgi:hypothetical protein
MTFGEVETWCEAYEIRSARMNELPRAIAGILLRAHGGSGDITDIFPLITDRARTKKALMTKEEFDAARNRNVRWQRKE